MDEPITVTKPTQLVLEPSHLNVVLHALEQLPFKLVREAYSYIEARVREQHGTTLGQKPDSPTPWLKMKDKSLACIRTPGVTGLLGTVFVLILGLVEFYLSLLGPFGWLGSSTKPLLNLSTTLAWLGLIVYESSLWYVCYITWVKTT